MRPVVILDRKQLDLTINRLAFQLTERYLDFHDTAIIGLQKTGAYLSKEVCTKVRTIRKDCKVEHGLLDVTFFRDDFGRRDTPLEAHSTELAFPIEGKRIILIDDVLFTGRTVRAAMDALMSLGRPRSVELMVLIDRRFSRHLPIEPSYTGKQVDSIATEHVEVIWTDKGFKQAILYDKSDKE